MTFHRFLSAPLARTARISQIIGQLFYISSTPTEASSGFVLRIVSFDYITRLTIIGSSNARSVTWKSQWWNDCLLLAAEQRQESHCFQEGNYDADLTRIKT